MMLADRLVVPVIGWIAARARQHALPPLSRDSHFDGVRNLERIPF